MEIGTIKLNLHPCVAKCFIVSCLATQDEVITPLQQTGYAHFTNRLG